MSLFRNFAASCALAATLSLGSPLAAQDISPPAIDVLSPHLTAIEFGRQNALTINSDAHDAFIERSGDVAATAVGQSLIASLTAPTTQLSAPARAVDTTYRYDRSRTARIVK